MCCQSHPFLFSSIPHSLTDTYLCVDDGGAARQNDRSFFYFFVSLLLSTWRKISVSGMVCRAQQPGKAELCILFWYMYTLNRMQVSPQRPGAETGRIRRWKQIKWRVARARPGGPPHTQHAHSHVHDWIVVHTGPQCGSARSHFEQQEEEEHRGDDGTVRSFFLYIPPEHFLRWA